MCLVRVQRLVRLFATLLLLASAESARAEPCRQLYEQAFATLATRDFRTIEKETNPADLQLKLDVEVYALFGDRRQSCEEGSYTLFLDRFQSYATDALRAPKDEKTVRLRTAISVFHKSPESIESSQGAELLQFRQTLANLRGVGQEIGMTILMRQLLETIEQVGPPLGSRQSAAAQAARPPEAAPAPAPAPAPVARPPLPVPPASPVEPHVEKVSVPTDPLPPWAVIALYEIEEHAKRNENALVLSKLRAILGWVKSVAPPPAASAR